MNQKIKDVLGAAIILALLVGAYGIKSYVDAYSDSIQPGTFRSFTVTGEAKIAAVPDIARFTFSVINEGGKDIAAIQKENADKSKKISDFLKEKGIDAKDIKTASYNVSPRYESYSCPTIYPLNDAMPRPCPPASIVGYTITQTTEVKIRDFAKINDIVGGVVDNGANNVSELSFAIDDPTKLQNEAKAQAIAKAKERAEELAKATGFKVGRLIAINDGGYYPMYADGVGGGLEYARQVKGMTSAAPVIEPGSQEVNVNVSLTYEIK